MSKFSSKIMCWNVWSILNEEKLSNVLQILDDNEIQVACICETWFDTKHGKFTTIIKDAGFEIVHAHREDQRGGGTAIIYRHTLNVKPGETSTSLFLSFEFSYVTFASERSKILLACIYRQQEVSCKIFCEELEKFIDGIFHKGDMLILVGDFNVWVDKEDDRDRKRLLTLMNAYGFTQLIQEPTHRNGHTLDHIYANNSQIELKYRVINGTFDVTTDHYPIIVDLPPVAHQCKKETVSFRCTKNIDINTVKTDFHLEVFQKMDELDHTDFKSKYDKYVTLSQKVVDKHAPLITRTIICKQNNPSWMDTEYKSNRCKRRKLERTWENNNTEENRTAYVNQRQLCAEMSTTKRQTYYSKVVDEAGNDQKCLFKIVNDLLDRNKMRSLPEHTDSIQLANDFNNYYIKKIDDIRKTIPNNPVGVNIPIDIFNGDNLNYFEHTTEDELKGIIIESGIKTSTEDPIAAHILRLIIDDALPCLTKLINESLSKGSMDGVKLSVIDPLLKKCGLDTDIKKNYRPVSNLVFFSKLIERLVLR